MSFSEPKKVESLEKLGNLFSFLSTNEAKQDQTISDDKIILWKNTIQKATQINPWFTKKNILFALKTWSDLLRKDRLNDWLTQYDFTSKRKNVAIIMAGNIPFVGFHDFICVWLSGNIPIVKTSSDDPLFFPLIIQFLVDLGHDKIEITSSKISNFDAVIATGSNNSSLYFEQYFSKYPHIFRKSKTSIAILDGSEKNEELIALALDIFSYFGLGCRNVTHLLIPENYDLNTFFGQIIQHSEIVNHHKYANNYDYHKAIFLLNREPFLDNGFVLLREHKEIFSPVSVLHYSRYRNEEQKEHFLLENKENIQAIIGKNYIPFGNAQLPSLFEYADGIDTLKWLSEL
ncbi:MAG: acyl-CoA reductase [Flavobacteriia bacterium]|nr:acyl-CoA reductase [Flavobacteriia bacterium]